MPLLPEGTAPGQGPLRNGHLTGSQGHSENLGHRFANLRQRLGGGIVIEINLPEGDRIHPLARLITLHKWACGKKLGRGVLCGDLVRWKGKLLTIKRKTKASYDTRSDQNRLDSVFKLADRFDLLSRE